MGNLTIEPALGVSPDPYSLYLIHHYLVQALRRKVYKSHYNAILFFGGRGPPIHVCGASRQLISSIRRKESILGVTLAEETVHENRQFGEDAKRLLDALASLEKVQWSEYDNKVKHEWRLSFAIWTALLAASGTILSGKVNFGQLIQLFEPLPIVVPAFVIIVLVILLHLTFLIWIQSKLQRSRKNLWKIRKKMEELVAVPCQEKEFTRRIYAQVSMYVQLFVTLVLGMVFIMIATTATPP